MIESHVVSLPPAKRLKELGVPQKSEFYWSFPPTEGVIMYGSYEGTSCVSAFLASELGEMLPDTIRLGVMEYGLLIEKLPDIDKPGKSVWWVSYEDNEDNILQCFTEINLVESLSAMLIHLIELGLVKV